MRKISFLLLIALTYGVNVFAQEKKEDTKIQISVRDVISEGCEYHIIESEPVNKDEPKERKPFVVVEQMPSFPGGDAKMMKFVADSIVYPAKAVSEGIQGRVVVRFVVNEDGTISNTQIVRGIDPLLDKEALRVISIMPKWNPGKQNGKEVPVYFTLPVVFRFN